MKLNSIETKIDATSEIVFGILWTMVTAVCTFGFYFTNGDVEVNGEMVSHEEFVTMLWPKLFIGIFWVIGISFIIAGIVNAIRYYSSTQYRKEDYEKNINFDNYEKFNDFEESDDDPIKRL